MRCMDPDGEASVKVVSPAGEIQPLAQVTG